MSGKECCIYVIAAVKDGEIAAPVKVGISDRPEARIGGIQTSCPFEVRLVHYLTLPDRGIARDLERMFHELHAKDCTRGEWFDMHPIKALQILCLNLHLALMHFTEFDEEEIKLVMDLAGAYDARKLWATQ
jgi:hypothetical protein